jgi:allantoinase
MKFPVHYDPIIDRKPIAWPNQARVAVCVVINVEYFEPGKPATSVNPGYTALSPDVYNHSWRDYGVRVGFWRLMRALDRLSIKATVTLNGLVCEHYPRIIEEMVKREWDIMGHGLTNSQMLAGLPLDEERHVIKETLDMIERATAKRPRGWLGPALAETWNTPNLLEELGVEFVCDWLNDDEPYRMATPAEKLLSVPYSTELNDIQCFLRANYKGPDYLQLLRDQFDMLYEEGAERGKVMTIPLHPFVIGHPFRMKYLEQALQYISSKEGVWMCTASDIADAFQRHDAAA